MKPLASLFLLCSIVLFSTTDGSAISRYNANTLTCGNIKAIIAAEGAVILRFRAKYNQGLTLHNRFVKNTSWCQLDEFAARQSIPTADQSSCRLRFCKLRDTRSGKRRGGVTRGTLGTTFLENQ